MSGCVALEFAVKVYTWERYNVSRGLIPRSAPALVTVQPKNPAGVKTYVLEAGTGVGTGVCVEDGTAVGTGVFVAVAVRVEVLVRVDVAVGVCVRVRVLVRVGVDVRVGDACASKSSGGI